MTPLGGGEVPHPGTADRNRRTQPRLTSPVITQPRQWTMAAIEMGRPGDRLNQLVQWISLGRPPGSAPRLISDMLDIASLPSLSDYVLSINS